MPDAEGQLKIFDINLRQGFYTKEILQIHAPLQHPQINDEELVTISRFGYPGIDLQDKCWILLAKYNLKMLILTCGTNGSYVFTPGVVSFQETPKVPVADTVGAGDWFHGSLHRCHSQREAVPDAHKLAVEVSAYVCTPERCHAGIAGRLERKAGIDFSYSFHIFRYLCSSAILNQRKVKMRQHNLRILFFLLVLWGVAVACSRREARFRIGVSPM